MYMEQFFDREELELLREEVKRLRTIVSLCTPSLEALLRRRGFEIYKKSTSDDLLVPADPAALDGWYEAMKRYSFRLFLRDVIKRQQEPFTVEGITRYATAGVTGEYTRHLLEAGVLEEEDGHYRLMRKKGKSQGEKWMVKSFGPTLEWFTAQLLLREFQAQVEWGVKLKKKAGGAGHGVGGDYDVVARLDGMLLYMEVKSSPPKQIYPNEIKAFLERAKGLSPDISVFFMDTELRMKDKIVPMFEEALPAAGPRPERFHKELFSIGAGMYIINAKGSVAMNMERVLAHYFISHRPPS